MLVGQRWRPGRLVGLSWEGRLEEGHGLVPVWQVWGGRLSAERWQVLVRWWGGGRLLGEGGILGRGITSMSEEPEEAGGFHLHSRVMGRGSTSMVDAAGG